MELRVLEYFLAVAREQSISAAASYMHLSQPTLSRQMKELEEELGTQLFIRGSRSITLTEEGMILRKRAEEIMNLVQKTTTELSLLDDSLVGEIYIGAGESKTMQLLAKAARQLSIQHPQIKYHLSSGDTLDVLDQLDKGLLDFGLVFGPCDLSKYNYFKIPTPDRWGVLVRRDHELASHVSIHPEDLWDKPLIISRLVSSNPALLNWLQKDLTELNIMAYYNLVYNASLMVQEGLGLALCIENIINVTGESDLAFRPLSPDMNADINFVWKKYRLLNKASEQFLRFVQNLQLQ